VAVGGAPRLRFEVGGKGAESRRSAIFLEASKRLEGEKGEPSVVGGLRLEAVASWMEVQFFTSNLKSLSAAGPSIITILTLLTI
jgi:hypothetical protein